MVHLQCSVEATHRAMLPDFPRNWDLLCLPTPAPQPPPSTCWDVLCARGWRCARLLPMDGAEKHRAVSSGCCCWAGRSSGCASTAEAGAGRAPGGAGQGLLQLFDLQPQQEMQSGAGLAAVTALGVWGGCWWHSCWQKLLQEQMLSVQLSGEAACCSSSLRGVPCLPSSTASAASPPQHRGC